MPPPYAELLDIFFGMFLWLPPYVISGWCAGDDSSLSGAVVTAFNDNLNSKLKALTQSLYQLKDVNRYTWKCVDHEKLAALAHAQETD